MKRWHSSLLWVFLGGVAFAGPELGPERVVLHTVGGDVVLAFYPKVAPKTSEQLLKLFRAGVFDTTHFFRVEPGFVLQTSRAQDRKLPLTPAQAALITRLPAEISPDVKHLQWRLTVARLDNDWGSGETSFSILLGDAPHLDGAYTVFGEVVSGFEAVQELLKVGWNSAHRPVTRLTIEAGTVLEKAEALKTAALLPAKKVVSGVALTEAESHLRLLLGGGLVVMLLISLLAFALRGQFTTSQLVALHLLQALVGGFFLTLLWLPLAQSWPWVGVMIFGLMLILFKGMNRFEAAN